MRYPASAGFFALARILLYGEQPHERQYAMRENKVEIKRPNLPLDPIVGEADSEYPEIKAAHNALLAEFKRLDEICSSQVEGVSWGFDKEKRLYSTSFSFAVLRRWGSSENWNTSLNYAFDTHISIPRQGNRGIALTMTLARA